MMKKLILAVLVCMVCSPVLAQSGPEAIWVAGEWRLSDEAAPVFLADTFLSLGQTIHLCLCRAAGLSQERRAGPGPMARGCR